MMIFKTTDTRSVYLGVDSVKDNILAPSDSGVLMPKTKHPTPSHQNLPKLHAGECGSFGEIA